MLFNSYEFIFLYLPVTLALYWWLARHGNRLALGWLTLASLGFYAWWNPANLLVLSASLTGNYLVGFGLSRLGGSPVLRKGLMVLGVCGNLTTLGYFKYATFIVGSANQTLGTHWLSPEVVLPLGISFITFQKIAFLVDTYQGKAALPSFLDFCLFVTFFPQLIAGPIVHPREILPQLKEDESRRPSPRHVAVGLTIFCIGLFKKTVLADGVAGYATPVFDAADHGAVPTFLEAWCGALAYTLQLYFDFSGYSDMAIGLGRLFGIRLPMNFHSPYKATNIIDFWRRWHITLSRFLRDYLYIPLGGNRKGPVRRYVNLFLTMLLGGLWHGAGWTFVLWGGLHGGYLIVNHAWDALTTRLNWRRDVPTWYTTWTARLVTFTAVVAGWVLFRATTLTGATTLLASMTGGHGFALSDHLLRGHGPLAVLATWLQAHGVRFAELRYYEGNEELFLLAGLLALVWTAPNTQQILAQWEPVADPLPAKEIPALPRWLRWEPSDRWAVAASLMLLVAILRMSRVSEFLYFQF